MRGIAPGKRPACPDRSVLIYGQAGSGTCAEIVVGAQPLGLGELPRPPCGLLSVPNSILGQALAAGRANGLAIKKT